MKFSAVAGSLAACAGLLGKLGADSDTGMLHAIGSQCAASSTVASLGVSCPVVQSIVRLCFIAMMLATNGVMLHFFVKGLHETDSLTATVTSAAVNFMLSAAGGWLFFQEHLPMQWFVGATTILVGMGLLLYGDYDAEADTTSKQSTQKKQS